MKPTQALFGIIAAGCLLAATQTQAAAYMKLGDIKGEATDADHKEWIEVFSVDWGVLVEPAAAGTTRGTPKPRPVTCAKELDKSSPKLMETIVTGVVLPRVEIHLTRDTPTGPVTYYKYELTNVLITSYQTGGSSADRPTEQVSLNFEEIKLIYDEIGTDGQSKGKVEASWKVEEGTN